ncbi:MAG: hypothetical protein ACHQ0Y_05850 [Thermodesulfovibrionales bacterium]
MIKSSRIVTGSLFLLMALFALNGCGSGHHEGVESPLGSATKVGSESCTNTCHADTKDITGNKIAAVWAATTHTTSGGVQCEDCHGPASLHWGVGPILFPDPQAAQCNVCHGKTGFDATAHANAHIPGGFFGPDSFFFQGDAGTGPADIRGVPEFLPDGITPVTKAQHIQECSACHNPNERFTFNIDGTLTKPDPNNMPNPVVSCASCHDAHQPEQRVAIAQRASVQVPIFRKFFVNATGEQSFVADPSTGKESATATSSQLAASLFQPNGAVQLNGSVDMTKVIGTNNELNIQRLCASCHTVGKYLYSQTATHQNDTYTQWANSAHGTMSDPAFAEFSANPPAYINPFTGTPYAAGGHQSLWPYDMAFSGGASFNGPGKVGATASTSQNAGFGGTNDNFACYRCHNGVASIAFQLNIQGTPAAPVIFGDEAVVCITCHDPHQNYPGQTLNVRQPVMMTNYSSTSITIQGNVFLDNTPVPLDKTGNGTICIFCHQGRESGLTLYATKLAAGKKITGNFFNPHYLGTAAMIWGVNAYEYAGQLYSANVAHQGANCPTCHMNNPTADNLNGGHTWTPNVASCNVSSCHGSFGAVSAKAASQSPDVATYRASFDTNNYTGDANGASLSIANSIRVLQQKVIAVLNTKGIFYNDLVYPYFFSDAASTTAFTAWTPATYKAAFNISFAVKGLPSAATSQANVPNNSAAVHDYKYIIQVLQDGYADLTGAPLAGAFRPAGTRPATVYGPGQ